LLSLAELLDDVIEDCLVLRDVAARRRDRCFISDGDDVTVAMATTRRRLTTKRNLRQLIVDMIVLLGGGEDRREISGWRG